MDFNYYDAPSQEIFDDIKENAIKIWNTYSDKFGYRSEKINRIKNIKNIEDNAWYIAAMFDSNNQAKLINMIQPETAEMLKQAIRGY